MRATCHDERFSNIHEIDISRTTFYPFVPMYIYMYRERKKERIRVSLGDIGSL